MPVLILVDLQNAAFGGFGIPPAHQAELLLRNASTLLQEARASGVPVVHVQHCAGRGEAFEEGAPGWLIAPRLLPAMGERVVRKHASNAFEGTDLHAVLQELGAGHLVITGIQSERCVSATCRGALGLGYEVRLAQDGHSTWPDAGRPAGDIIAAQNETLEREGVRLSSTEELVERLRAGRPSAREPGVFRAVNVEDLPWRPSTMAPGVFVKDIAVTDGWEMQVVRFEPGARFPAHTHERPEFLFILEGELVQGGRRMGPGWASVAGAGTIDEDVHSETGCVFVLVDRA